MKSSGTLLLLTVLLFWGCGHDSEAAHEAEAPVPEATHEATHDEAEDAIPAGDPQPDEGGGLPTLALNGGERWAMDDHTRTAFATMEARLSEHDGDALDLGSALQQDTNALIAGCTMEGPAHDALHDFLTTFLPALGRFAETGDPEAEDLVREHLELVPTYFE